jgi:hypothetical protein
MFNIQTVYAYNLPMQISLQAELLCKPDSEMHQLFERISSGGVTTEDCETIIACAYIKPFKSDRKLIGWASVSTWWVKAKMKLQVQSYVSEEYRRSGVATSCIAAATLGLPRSTPVAVFSDECERIATRLRLNSELWKRVPDGWIRLSGPQGGHSQ